jgi:ABC-type transport system involved in multi-copper enzyme maturation permease subunit
MIPLVRTELRRCWSRRSVHLFGGLALAGITLTAVLVFVNSAKPRNACPNPSCFKLVDLTQVFQGTSAPLIILGIALAASFMGAEWGAGTMTTLLTWEPRRIRVYVAKLIAAAIFTFVSAVFLQIVLGLTLLPSAVLNGSTAGADAGWLVSTAGSLGRGALIAALGAGIGLAIGSLARNTTAAVLIAFFYIFVLENVVRGLKPGWIRWMVGENAGVFILGHRLISSAADGEPLISHTPLQGLLVVCGYVGILSAAAIALFLRRDVT